MKFFISIMLIFQFALQALAPSISTEILKLPNLFEHYSDHKELKEHDNISFLRFLMDDYIGHDNEHKDHHDNSHEDLPFHDEHTCNHICVFVATESSLPDADLNLQQKVDSFISSFSSRYPDSLFHPPKN